MSTALIEFLFPSQAREFRGQRWVNVGLRCAHLLGVAGIGGGFLFDLHPQAWASYWHLTLASGVALSLIYIWSTAIWLCEIKGLAIIFKNILLAVAIAVPAARGELFIAIVVISGLVAHAPARVRSRRWLRWPKVAGYRSGHRL